MQLNEEQLVLLQASPVVPPTVSSVIATIQADIEGGLSKEGAPKEALDRKDEMLQACSEAGAILQKLILFQEALRAVGVGGGQGAGAETTAATPSPTQGEAGPPAQTAAEAVPMDANAPREGGTASTTPTATAATAATASNGVNMLQYNPLSKTDHTALALQEGPKRVNDVSDDDLLKGRTKFRKSPY